MIIRMPETRRLQAPLTREQVIELIVAWEPQIRALGVQRLAPFGSVVRGQARPDSDVDLLVQFFPSAKTYSRFFALSELLETCLGCRVELVPATRSRRFEVEDLVRRKEA
jgi:predicted nucleotidyltransferase